MIDKESENLDDYLTGLAQELADILSANLLLDHTTTDEAMKRARDIREEIESYGILATYTGELSDDLLNIKIAVTLLKPKGDMSPEAQEIYQKWLQSRQKK